MTRPRFLADESCDFTVVRALRVAGYDVRAVAEDTQRSKDGEVIDEAGRDGRVLLCEDKDFGWHAFVRGATAGVVLMRFPARARSALAAMVVDVVRAHGHRLNRAFTVVQPGQVRITPRADTTDTGDA